MVSRKSVVAWLALGMMVLASCGGTVDDIAVSGDDSLENISEALSPCPDGAGDHGSAEDSLGQIVRWVSVESGGEGWVEDDTSTVTFEVGGDSVEVGIHQEAQAAIAWGLENGEDVLLGLDESDGVFASLVELSSGESVFTGSCAEAICRPYLNGLGITSPDLLDAARELTGEELHDFLIPSA